MKILFGISIIIFGLGVTLFLGCYLPYRLWNESAIKGYCDVKGVVNQGTCNRGGCWKVYFVTNVVGTKCKSSEYGGTYNTKEQAEAWAHGYLRSHSCFYQKTNSCDNSRNIRDTFGAFIASCVFTGIGIVMLIIWVIVIVHKRGQYMEVYI